MSSSLKIWHPFTNAALDPSPIFVERAEGVWLHTRDGRKILDAVSSWWVNLHGHANPRIAAAIAEQARKMEHVIFAGFTHEPAERLAAGLRKWLAPLGRAEGEPELRTYFFRMMGRRRWKLR